MLGRLLSRLRRTSDAETDAGDRQTPDPAAAIGELLDNGELDAAKRAFDLLVTTRPAHPRLDLLRARIALLENDPENAHSILRLAYSGQRDDGELVAYLAAATMSLGRAEEALTLADRAASLGYRRAWLLEMAGVAHFHAERFEEAIGCWKQSLELEPQRPNARRNLVEALAKLGRWREIEQPVRQLIDSEAASPRYLAYLANSLDAQGREQEAWPLFERSAASPDADAIDLRNYAVALFRAGRLDAARPVLLRALELDPSQHLLDVMVANADLIEHGSTPHGWARYERRTALYPTFFRTESRRWDGKPLGSGESLLVYGEQGIGDILLFARWLPRVARAACGPVHFGLPASLARLMRQTATLRPDWAGIHVHDQYRPSGLAQTVELPLMSVPLTLDPPIQRVAEPYLAVDPELQKPWAQQLGPRAGLRVGLVWAGNPNREDDAIRSIPTEQLAALDDPELRSAVQFIRLQMDARPEYSVPLPLPHIDPTPAIRDFADTAAIMRTLDLVISIDTGAAHLAGAIGVECWTLLSLMPDWRWSMKGVEQPWYGRHRSFRVARNRDWSVVLIAVREELRARIRGDR